MTKFLSLLFISVCLSLMLGLNACKPIDTQENTINLLSDSFGLENYWLVNEGNFQWGRGKLILLNKADLKTFNASAFNPDIEGNVFQSIAFTDKEAWLVFNNSGKILVIDKKSLKTISTIQGLNSPRYIAFNDSLAYVSDLFNNKISIISQKRKLKVGEIAVNQWVEKLWIVNKKYLLAYTKKNDANPAENSSSLLLFNLETNTLKDEYIFKGRIAEAQYVLGRGLVAVNSLLNENTRRAIYTFYVDEITNEIKLSDSLVNNQVEEFQNVSFFFPNLHSKSAEDGLLLCTQGNKLSCYGIEIDNSITDFTYFIRTLGQIKNSYRISQVSNSMVAVSDAQDFVSRGSVSFYTYINEPLSQYTFIPSKTVSAEVIPSHIYDPADY